MQIYAITFEKLSRRKKTKRNDMKSHGKNRHNSKKNVEYKRINNR